MDKSKYETDLSIDEDTLDRDFIRQPILYMEYAKMSAEADSEAKRAKEKLEYIGAKVYREIIRSYDKKPTDMAIKSEIALDKEYRVAQEEYFNKKYEADLLASAVKAFEHRKSALENLTKLWVGGYFSTPRQSKESEHVKNEKRTDRQRRRLNKGRKGDEEE